MFRCKDCALTLRVLAGFLFLAVIAMPVLAQDFVTWSSANPFEGGYSPAVAISGSTVVEAHQSASGMSTLSVTTGQLQPSGAILWNTPAAVEEGYAPSIAVSGAAVLLVHQNTSGPTIKYAPVSYRVGQIQSNGSVQWSAEVVGYEHGAAPSVALTSTVGGLNVVEVHENPGVGSLSYCTGELTQATAGNTTVNWLDCAVYDNGYAPSVAVSGTSVVEAHQAGTGQGALWYHTGQIQTNNTIAWNGSVEYGYGIGPHIALSGTTALQVDAYETAATWYYFQSGEVSGATIQWSPSSPYDNGSSMPSVGLSGRNAIDMHADTSNYLRIDTGTMPSTWTIANTPANLYPMHALLLTDGSVIVQSAAYGAAPNNIPFAEWWRLVPDITGSYANGKWTQLPSLPSGYAPLYYASAVLPDGRMLIEGGEYNYGANGALLGKETTRGAIYDPVQNTWTTVAPPAGWTMIGDAPSVVLADGSFMLGATGGTQQAILNATTMAWTATGTDKEDANSEEGWTLLPNNEVLTIDTNNTGDPLGAEIYNPTTGSWSSAGSTPVVLTIEDFPTPGEIGPAILRPDGTVFATGVTGATAIYNSASGKWTTGPTLPQVDGTQAILTDAPAALLPDGNVLLEAGVGTTATQFFEFNGTSISSVANPVEATSGTDTGNLLVLPTGQIWLSDENPNVELYTSSGTYSPAWQPAITAEPSVIYGGTGNYSISGTQLNGLSQGAMYGDDAQMATNYPIVKIVNNMTLHVFYARTHSFSSMGVATGSAVVSAEFDTPATLESGPCTLTVVANGISSAPVQATCVQ